MTTQETVDQAASVLWDALDAADPSGYTDSELGTIDVREVDMRVVARALADAGLLADPDAAAEMRRRTIEIDDVRKTNARLNRRAQLAEAALHKQLKHPNGAQDPTVNALAERVRELEATIQRVRDLADAWDNIPQYVATVYDTGRSNQREMCLQELLTALDQEEA